MIKHKDNPLFNNRSKIWIKELIQILIGKNILISYHKGFGFIIDVGKKNIDELLPIKARINNDIQNSLKNFTINTGNDTLEKLYELRVKMAEAKNVNPTTFINDRVILNIHDSKPKTLTALWAIDGISDEFVMNYGTEFIEELKKINKKSKNKSKGNSNSNGKGNSNGNSNSKETARDITFKHYNDKKSLKDIIKITGKTSQTIEGHILHIFEHYENIEIDPEYFGLTEEYEEEIKDVVKNIGSDYLKPIKDAVNNKITYGQIKVCLLIIKIGSEE
jgi:ATP-dependent DNA helicase RecQ